MGVELSGRDARMAQELLHDTQIGAALQKMGREAMPQAVGMQPLDAHVPSVALDERMDRLARDSAADRKSTRLNSSHLR